MPRANSTNFQVSYPMSYMKVLIPELDLFLQLFHDVENF